MKIRLHLYSGYDCYVITYRLKLINKMKLLPRFHFFIILLENENRFSAAQMRRLRKDGKVL